MLWLKLVCRKKDCETKGQRDNTYCRYSRVFWGHLVGNPIGYLAGHLVGQIAGHFAGHLSSDFVAQLVDKDTSSDNVDINY